MAGGNGPNVFRRKQFESAREKDAIHSKQRIKALCFQSEMKRKDWWSLNRNSMETTVYI